MLSGRGMVAQVDRDSVGSFQGGAGRAIGKDCPGLGALVTHSHVPALFL